MERYSSYKDSGLQWLGEIPSHWEVVPLKSIVSCNDDTWSETTAKDTLINYVEISDVSLSEGITKITQVKFADAPSRARRKTRVGDIIVSTVRTYLQAIAPIDEENITVSTGFAVLRPNTVDNRFLLYYTASSAFISDVIANSKGTSYPAINANDLVHLKTLLPPTSEQQTIAAYLDEATSKIDAAIAQQQKMIDLLNERKQIIINNAVTKGMNPNVKMKDSGVDWIGEIPEHWEVKKAKLCVTISNGSDPKTEGNIPVYGSGASSFRTCGEYKEGPCVLIGRKGATLHIPHYIQGRYWNVDTAFDVKTKNGIQLKYYYYLATCFDYPYYMSQTTLPSMTSFDYNRMKLPLPPEAEQKDIIDKLEQKLFVFDNAISSIEKQISLLQERKQIIINEVVTGKVKVC